MALRKMIVGILAMMMVSPAWGVGEPMGSVTSSINATVRDTKLEARGGARIALKSGAQAEILGPSSVRLTVADNAIQMVVDRDQRHCGRHDGASRGQCGNFGYPSIAQRDMQSLRRRAPPTCSCGMKRSLPPRKSETKSAPISPIDSNSGGI